MRELLTNENRRHYSLLSILYHSSKPRTLQGLSHDLTCSTRTLSRDITFLNSSNTSLKINSTPQGISLFLPTELSFDYIIQQTLKQSNAHRFLEFLYLQPQLPTETLTERLFFSHSSLKRLIATIRLKLAPFNLQLASKPYRLVGDEQNLAIFLFAYLKERYPNPLALLTPKQLQFLNPLADQLRPALPHYPFSDLPYILLVVLKTNRTPPLDSHPLLGNLWSQLVPQKELLAAFQQLFKTQLDLSLLSDLCRILRQTSHNYQLLAAFSLDSQPPLSFTQANLLNQHLENYLGLSFQHYPLLKADLNTFYHRHLQPVVPQEFPLSQPSKISFEFSQSFLCFSNFLKQTAEDVQFSYLLPLVSELLHLFERHWPRLELPKKAPTNLLKIGILTLPYAEAPQLLLARLDDYLGPNYQLTLINELDSAELALVNNFDLLITCYSREDLKHAQVICLSYLPTAREWQNLKTQLTQLIIQKNMT